MSRSVRTFANAFAKEDKACVPPLQTPMKLACSSTWQMVVQDGEQGGAVEGLRVGNQSWKRVTCPLLLGGRRHSVVSPHVSVLVSQFLARLRSHLCNRNQKSGRRRRRSARRCTWHTTNLQSRCVPARRQLPWTCLAPASGSRRDARMLPQPVGKVRHAQPATGARKPMRAEGLRANTIAALARCPEQSMW